MTIDILIRRVKSMKMKTIILPTSEILTDIDKIVNLCQILDLSKDKIIQRTFDRLTYKDIALGLLKHDVGRFRQVISEIDETEADMISYLLGGVGKSIYDIALKYNLYKGNYLMYHPKGYHGSNLIVELLDPNEYDIL